MQSEARKVLTVEMLPLLLTAVIAVAACISTYFTYQTAKIASEQVAREQRRELIEWVTLFKELSETVKKLEQNEKSKGNPEQEK